MTSVYDITGATPTGGPSFIADSKVEGTGGAGATYSFLITQNVTWRSIQDVVWLELSGAGITTADIASVSIGAVTNVPGIPGIPAPTVDVANGLEYALLVPNGVKSFIVNIQVNPDANIEQDELLEISLGTIRSQVARTGNQKWTDGAILPGFGQAFAIIKNDDGANPGVSIRSYIEDMITHAAQDGVITTREERAIRDAAKDNNDALGGLKAPISDWIKQENTSLASDRALEYFDDRILTPQEEAALRKEFEGRIGKDELGEIIDVFNLAENSSQNSDYTPEELISTTTVGTFINALFPVMYNRTADSFGLDGNLNGAAPQQGSDIINDANVYKLGQQFATSSFFASEFGSLTDSNFILKLYTNLGGNTDGVDGSALDYWAGRLASLGEDRGQLTAEFTKAFLEYGTRPGENDPAGLTRTEQLLNKVAVSEAWVEASREAGNEFMNAMAEGDAAYLAQQKVLQGVDSTAASLEQALSQVAMVAETGDLSQAVGVEIQNTGSNAETESPMLDPYLFETVEEVFDFGAYAGTIVDPEVEVGIIGSTIETDAPVPGDVYVLI